MAPRLKVFQYSDGFHAWTVATTSRAKALEAWGVTRDLFKDGAAREIDDGPDHEAALGAPGELIERGVAVDIGNIAKAKTPKPSAAQRKAFDAVERLEADLKVLEAAQADKTAAIDERREALDREARALQQRQSRTRRAMESKLASARKKLR